MARRFDRLAADSPDVKCFKHENTVTPFPADVKKAASKLDAAEARAQLGAWVSRR